MLAPGMRPSYQEYKDGTDIIANWLAKSARACGYEFNAVRKGKKKRVNGFNPVITVRQFQELARFLANHSISSLSQQSCRDFLSTLDRNIQLRNAHNDWYNANILNNERDQVTHEFFVDSLRKVRSTLGSDFVSRASVTPMTVTKPAPLRPVGGFAVDVKQKLVVPMTATPEPRGRALKQPFVKDRFPATASKIPSSPAPPSVLMNKFAGLQMEDIEDADPAADDLAEVSHDIEPVRDMSPQFRAEQVKDDQEMWLVIRCFLDDLRTVRGYVEEAVNFYGKRETMIWLVSVIADVAVDHVRRSEQEFLELFSEENLVDRVRELLQVYRRTRLAKPAKKARSKSSKWFSMDDWELAEPILLPALAILDSFRDFSKPWLRDFGTGSQKHFTLPLAPGSPPRDVYENQLHYVRSIFADLALVAKEIPHLRMLDQLTEHVASFLEVGTISLTAALALQILLDTRVVLDRYLSAGYTDLYNTVLVIDRNIERSMTLQQMIHDEKFALANIGCFDNTFRTIDELVCEDTIKTKRIKCGYPVQRDVDHHLMKLHPMLSGTMLFRAQYNAAREAVDWCNLSTVIIKSMHLYNACLTEGLLSQKWPSMERLMDIYTVKHLFIGNRPTKQDDYYKRFCLASGYSVRFFARDACGCGPNSRNKLINIRSTRSLRFADATPIMTRLIDRYEGNARAAAEAMYQVEQMEAPNPLHSDTKASRQVKMPTTVASDEPRFAKRDLLIKLSEVLDDERPALEFDYLKLDRECWALLDMICQVTEPLLSSLGYAATLKSFDDHMQVPNVVFPILSEVSLEKSEAKCIDCKTRYSTSGLQLLKEAASCVEYAIKTFNGNKLHTLYQMSFDQGGSLQSFVEHHFTEDSPLKEEILSALQKLRNGSSSHPADEISAIAARLRESNANQAVD